MTADRLADLVQTAYLAAAAYAADDAPTCLHSQSERLLSLLLTAQRIAQDLDRLAANLVTCSGCGRKFPRSMMGQSSSMIPRCPNCPDLKRPGPSL
jgi:hypothetical protein